MRGLGAGYTQILINGERAPAGFSMDSLAPDVIERIEVLLRNDLKRLAYGDDPSKLIFDSAVTARATACGYTRPARNCPRARRRAATRIPGQQRRNVYGGRDPPGRLRTGRMEQGTIVTLEKGVLE